MIKYLAISLLLLNAVCLETEHKGQGKEHENSFKKEEEPQCPPEADYTFNLLTLFWGPQFCQRQEGQCRSDWQNGWSGTLATIHGYWPSSAEASYLDCFGYNGDSNCEGFPYNYNIIANDTELVLDMSIYWPEISEATTDGWYDHEWDKHGTCYLMNFMDTNSKVYEKDEEAFNNTVFTSYFADTIAKAKKLNINLNSGTRYENKLEIARDIGLKPSHFRIKCYGDDKLNEIMICYNRSDKPGEEVLIDCPPELPFHPDDEIEIDCYQKPFYIV